MKLRTSHILKILGVMTLIVIVNIQSLQAQNNEPSPLLLANAQEQYQLGMHLEILEDPMKQWTIEDIASPEFASRFEPSETIIPSKGFSESAYWIRFQVQNQSELTEWWLHHTRADVNFIDLYIPHTDGSGFKTIQTGALMPFETRDIPALAFVFQLSLPPQSTQTVYLRYEHNRATDLPLQLFTPSAFVNYNQLELWTMGIAMGLTLILMIIFFYLSYKLRSKALIFAGLALSFFFVNNAVLNGFVSQFVFPNLGAWFIVIEFLTGGLLLVALLRFISIFMNTAQRYPNWHKVIQGLTLFCLLIILQTPFLGDRLVGQQLTIIWLVSLVQRHINNLNILFTIRKFGKLGG